MKPKICKGCKTSFDPYQPFQQVCSPPCALVVAIKQREKAATTFKRKQARETRVKLKTRREWLREAQAAINKWVRLRDDNLPCISCGRHHTGQYHAGHYLTTGSRPELRFNELNIHKQCAPCNNHLSGNLIMYRVGLIAKIGLADVESLEGPHPPSKWTIEQLKEIKVEYKRRVRGLTDEQGKSS